MKRYLLALSLMTGVVGCKGKEKVEDKHFISVVSLIKKQVEQIDTSLFSIIKVVIHDSTHIDTSYIPRENFAAVASDFLSIPDLSERKVAKRYMEEPARYDDMLKKVIFTYLPVDPDKEEIKRQELLVTPIPGEESKVSNIYVVREISNRDSFFQQQMLWLMDRSFQITARSQKPGKPEVVTTTKVYWNEGLTP